MAPETTTWTINSLIQQDWAKYLALPLLYGVFRFIKYLVERKVEGKKEAESISQLSQLADLKAKLDKNGMSIDELQTFRAKALGKSVTAAIAIAKSYTDAAEQLAISAERTELDPDWNQALTQTDMNRLSARKAAQADDELAARIEVLLSELGTNDVELLNRSQESWESFRESEVARESGLWEGGSVRPLMVNLKYEAITRQRIASLSSEQVEASEKDIEIKTTKTPRNLLRHVEPTVPRDRVRDLLGVPSYTTANRWYYRFEDTQVEISFNAEEAVDDVVVALCHGYIYDGYSPGDVDVPLGKLTLAHLLKRHEGLQIRFRSSMRTQEVYVQGRVGPPGAWTYFCYGALTVHSGAGNLETSEFEWDRHTNQLATDPSQVLINWVALPGSSIDVPLL